LSANEPHNKAQANKEEYDRQNGGDIRSDDFLEIRRASSDAARIVVSRRVSRERRRCGGDDTSDQAEPEPARPRTMRRHWSVGLSWIVIHNETSDDAKPRNDSTIFTLRRVVE